MLNDEPKLNKPVVDERHAISKDLRKFAGVIFHLPVKDNERPCRRNRLEYLESKVYTTSADFYQTELEEVFVDWPKRPRNPLQEASVHSIVLRLILNRSTIKNLLANSWNLSIKRTSVSRTLGSLNGSKPKKKRTAEDSVGPYRNFGNQPSALIVNFPSTQCAKKIEYLVFNRNYETILK